MGAVRLGQGAPTIGENPRPDAISDSQTVRPCLFFLSATLRFEAPHSPAELPSAAAPTPTGVCIRVRLGGSRAHPPPRTASRAAPTLAGLPISLAICPAQDSKHNTGSARHISTPSRMATGSRSTHGRPRGLCAGPQRRPPMARRASCCVCATSTAH